MDAHIFYGLNETLSKLEIVNTMIDEFPKALNVSLTGRSDSLGCFNPKLLFGDRSAGKIWYTMNSFTFILSFPTVYMYSL